MVDDFEDLRKRESKKARTRNRLEGNNNDARPRPLRVNRNKNSRSQGLDSLSPVKSFRDIVAVGSLEARGKVKCGEWSEESKKKKKRIVKRDRESAEMCEPMRVKRGSARRGECTRFEPHLFHNHQSQARREPHGLLNSPNCGHARVRSKLAHTGQAVKNCLYSFSSSLVLSLSLSLSLVLSLSVPQPRKHSNSTRFFEVSN